MQLADEKADALKSWVVKRLENISDADPEVLGDYVLALLRSDAPGDEVRKTSILNLEDFLRDHTIPFVNELFAKFLPITAPLSPTTPTGTLPGLNTTTTLSDHPLPIQAYDPTAPLDLSNKSVNAFNQSRKRPRDDQGDPALGREPYYNGKTSTIKAPRGPRMNRDDRFSKLNRHNQSPDPIIQAFGRPNGSQMPMPPIPPPGLSSLNPNDLMSSLMAMQALMPNLQGTWDSTPPAKTFAALLPPRIGQRCKDYDTKGFCVRGSSCPYEHGNDHIVAPITEEEYDPANAIIGLPKSKNGYGTRGNSSRGRSTHRGARGRGDHSSKNSRRDSRADYSDPRPNFDRTVTTIVVEQIPEEYFQEDTVRDFFSQHGTVLDVTLKPYKHLALVKYGDWASAKRAYESPKVIFDNRFVKVYWYKPMEEDQRNNATTKAGTAESSHSPVSPTSTRTDEPANHEDVLLRQAEAQKNYEVKAKARREMEEARQALQRQQEEVVKKHEAEKAELIAKIAAKEALKKGSPSPPADKSGDKVNQSLREQLAKLEAEAVSLGLDPNVLAEDSQNAPGGYRGRGRGRGFYAPTRFPTRGRGSYRGSYRGGWTAPRGGGVMRLDNRPKRVAIKGPEWTAERDEALRHYLLTLGPFESIDRDPAHPGSQIVSYQERYMAEQLMHGTTDVPGVGTVEMSWVAGPTSSGTGGGGGHARNRSDGDVVMSGSGAGGDEGAQGEDKAVEGAPSKDAHHEVEYDVAEEDDWGIE